MWLPPQTQVAPLLAAISSALAVRSVAERSSHQHAAWWLLGQHRRALGLSAPPQSQHVASVDALTLAVH